MANHTAKVLSKTLTVVIDDGSTRVTVPMHLDDFDDARAARVRELITASATVARWEAIGGGVGQSRAQLARHERDAIIKAILELGGSVG